MILLKHSSEHGNSLWTNHWLPFTLVALPPFIHSVWCLHPTASSSALLHICRCTMEAPTCWPTSAGLNFTAIMFREQAITPLLCLNLAQTKKQKLIPILYQLKLFCFKARVVMSTTASCAENCCLRNRGNESRVWQDHNEEGGRQSWSMERPGYRSGFNVYI